MNFILYRKNDGISIKPLMLNNNSPFLFFSRQGVNLVADIGGQLGLWIGISVLTCCEFLELAIVLIQTVIGRVRRRKLIHIQP